MPLLRLIKKEKKKPINVIASHAVWNSGPVELSGLRTKTGS